MMALTRAAALPGDMPEKTQTAESHLVKRSTSCSAGWSLFSGRCFRYVPKPMTWAKAERNCRSMGANLASVHSTQDYHKIQNLILTTTHQQKETWIGGSDAQEENIWFWSDGSPFHYSNWCHGQPSHFHGRQHCLQMNYEGQKCWDDVECNVHLPSICVKKGR
ncbi:ladderlectin-like isoform X1 [Seriola dumerili]|uniref:ladderlectin-like isoform X1 n=1 Tax=Seriola dumerili TaxID=41447 RepID=UPI000BBE9A5E|nr:ladderlectin-like isoform X1 [Seriola dumerili]